MKPSTLPKLVCITLALALNGIASASLAVPPGRDAAFTSIATFATADHPSQGAGTEPDCKKDPDDPRCRDKK